MSRCGDVYQNKVTGEYSVVLRGTEDRGDGPGIVYMTLRPGGAVAGEHFHPHITERFSVVRGRLDARIDGKLMSLGPGQSAFAAAGVPHDWWNASATEETHIVIEIDRPPGSPDADFNRFEMMIGMLFGLANNGKADRKGRPFLLPAAVLAQEFSDIIVFTHPPPAVQRVVLGVLAPLGRLLGYPAIRADYCRPHSHVEPEPEMLAAAGLPTG